MKILQLCKKFPFPLKDGESIAVTYLSKALNTLGCEITLLAMNTTKHYFDLNTLPVDFNHYKSIHVVDLDNRIKLQSAFLNLFSNESYHVVRYISEDYRLKLIQLLDEDVFDIIQMETIYLAPYIDTIRAHSDALIVQRSHNVEFEIWERVAGNAKAGPRKWYLNLLAKRLRRFETAQLNRYDLLLAITERDKNRFEDLGCRIPMLTVPIGLETAVYRSKDYGTVQPGTIGFIGSMDWMPNLEGIQWFLEMAWAMIIKQFPEVQLHLAGRNTPAWLLEKKLPNLVIHGEVEDARAFMATKDIMIVPLLSGGGMKVKILESLILGTLTITTSLGLEGIPAKDHEEILIADTPEAFVEKVGWVLKNRRKATMIKEAGVEFAVKHFDNLEIAKKVKSFYHGKKIAV